MDIITIIGVISGISLISGAIILGGQAFMFVSLESIMIVGGGTLAATMINYSYDKLAKLPDLIRIAFSKNEYDSEEIIQLLVSLAEKARREGLLALEQDAMEADDEFLQKGIQLVVDGTDPELVRSILETKLTFIEERHSEGRGILSKMGTLSPAFGMIGTLIGLIQMLADLDDPTELGQGMAVALLTTFYGALIANLIFIPMAGKLETTSQDEILLKEVMIEGILSIQAGENPRIVEEKLRAFLAESEGEEEEEAQPAAGTEEVAME
ncbi:motility protein A [Halarsenatibacter silvermanii]|uniref:Chemotaxis protein MotA n=1 Tax=Halarsenatibacter silvermanii TaxID=321763 RepID=A0A1G9MJW2_9FIRM|nr:MotA/TolQ/ExbB proton channel family protein [Halarsenatibacter silvermanii]SDL73925.1 chemotaxis protein MotA [Halarsenatibacter silvermanii]